MKGLLKIIIFGLCVTVLPMSVYMVFRSPDEPNRNDYYYRGGKTIRRQSKQNNRKKTLRYKK